MILPDLEHGNNSTVTSTGGETRSTTTNITGGHRPSLIKSVAQSTQGQNSGSSWLRIPKIILTVSAMGSASSYLLHRILYPLLQSAAGNTHHADEPPLHRKTSEPSVRKLSLGGFKMKVPRLALNVSSGAVQVGKRELSPQWSEFQGANRVQPAPTQPLHQLALSASTGDLSTMERDNGFTTRLSNGKGVIMEDNRPPDNYPIDENEVSVSCWYLYRSSGQVVGEI
jgi:hypothetical protein